MSRVVDKTLIANIYEDFSCGRTGSVQAKGIVVERRLFIVMRMHCGIGAQGVLTIRGEMGITASQICSRRRHSPLLSGVD